MKYTIQQVFLRFSSCLLLKLVRKVFSEPQRPIKW